MDKKRGVSLIVLVITIVVVIILAAAVIMNLTGNNPINNAKITKVCNNYDNIKTDISLYINNAKVETKSYFTTQEILTGTGSVRAGVFTSLDNEKVEKNDDGKTWNAKGYSLIDKTAMQEIEINNGDIKEAYEIQEDKYKELINALPKTPTSDAKWYVDLDTNVYLVYDKLDDIPKWLRSKAKGNKITEDSTLSMFLAVKDSIIDEDNLTLDYDPEKVFKISEDGTRNYLSTGQC